MTLVQLTTRRGELARVPYRYGDYPVVELHLGANQRVVQLELTDTTAASWMSSERKTHDWTWVATVETRL